MNRHYLRWLPLPLFTAMFVCVGQNRKFSRKIFWYLLARGDSALICPLVALQVHANYTGKYVNDGARDVRTLHACCIEKLKCVEALKGKIQAHDTVSILYLGETEMLKVMCLCVLTDN